MAVRGCTLTNVLGCLSIAVSLVSTAGAEVFYSVDTQSDELVRVDTQNGNIETVGAIGQDMVEVDLTYFNGVLYALNNQFGSPAEIVPINPETGVGSGPIRLHHQGEFVTNAEGLTRSGNNLYVSFDSIDTQGDPLASNALGRVTPTTGFIFDAFDYAALAPDADMEALGLRETDGQVFGVDNDGNDAELFEIDIDPPAFNTIGNVPIFQDMVFLGDRLFAHAEGVGLFELDSYTGELVSPHPLVPTGSLSGIAVVPEPAGVLLLAAGPLLLRRR